MLVFLHATHFTQVLRLELELGNILIIELHDRMKKGCTESFLIAVNKYRWVQYIRGEHIILVKESPVTEYRALLIPNYYH
ncbi:MAG: hypothetical protein A3D52_00900 [Candidatus Taylorbacteria bacterium RIFCSPHIGHO2_02_FULL_44_36]|uniref:Uncharacterized protein n=1 Tax=Candidatus Taylorbacteria bacterium RIFCSPLOWO2_12_FULL_44_15c TaxID=1802333 RepID=A0A1G2P616_9BACT|nr:MAG: hypothetical protein A3D52_00900 [Candidatus Taylorbacteria bacterium RIFCSPHIGHO2_02_FULL_44_36]OHA37717.1 MAG: hypothetical protein A3I97_03195 [Candidatus Taylorbacteria bacterium RIFCSPLOWO2_02_FULL_44_35]OHA43784.1 MAG: hypothetical protein A3G03_02160 [Candidatus Taylorbacteria bacterium RIFCSPLOWO2_12_FULL_44_15c]